MMTPLETRHSFTHVLVALSAGTLIAVAATSERAWARDSMAQAAQVGATGDRCSSIPPGFGHPPPQVFSPTLQVLQRSVEPVPATDGLIHLAYAALVTNTLPQPLQIASVVPVDPLAGFNPTGRNLITDLQGRDVAGKVKLFHIGERQPAARPGGGAGARARLLDEPAGRQFGVDVL